MAEPESTLAEIFVVSDGTGDTCAAAVRAAMLQFQNPSRVRIFGGLRHPSQVRRVIDEAARAGALIVFSLVDNPVADALVRQAEEKGVGSFDLIGPLIARFAQRLHAEPKRQPGLLHGFSGEYFQRVEAVEFAVRHDDGTNTHTLFEADIVLTGVSRTSKTPLTMYLAQRGYKTGNVPLVPNLDPPQALLELDPWKVFALDIDETTLLSVRQARARAVGVSPYATYTDTDAIALELSTARRFCRQRGWRIIDVSGRAVEENASRILELYGESRPSDPS